MREPANPLGQYILDDHGEPRPEPDLLTWGRWMETHNAERVVKQEEPIPGVRVSTVFLALDHGFSFNRPPAPPVLWETMIFGGVHDGYQARYTSRAEAEVGHRRAVDIVIEGD